MVMLELRIERKDFSMISQHEYQARRQKLAAQLPANSIAVVAAAQEAHRNGDAHYRFRQDSDFHYLTGFNEPDALLVVISGTHCQSILFNRTRNPAEEQWTGKRLGQEGAVTELQMNAAFPIHALKIELPKLLMGKESIYYSFGKDSHLEEELMNALMTVKAQVRKGVKAPDNINDLEPILGEMRLFKSEAEIALMRRAAEISVAAHIRAMQACAKAHNEYELEAELIYELADRDVEVLPMIPSSVAGRTPVFFITQKIINPSEKVI